MGHREIMQGIEARTWPRLKLKTIRITAEKCLAQTIKHGKYFRYYKSNRKECATELIKPF